MQRTPMKTDTHSGSRFGRIRTDVAQIIFGPWPIRPTLIGFITFVVLQYASGVLAQGEEQVVLATLSTLPANILRAAALAIVLAALLTGYRRITGRQEPGRVAYLVILFVTGWTTATTRFFLTSDLSARDLPLYLAFVLRATILLMIVTSSLGVADARLRKQIRQTDEALEVVRAQRSVVLEAEERARQSIATILHDRVQAGLVAATLQLKQLATAIRGEEGARLESVIADLEMIRTQDVRSASRQLSPDLRNITLTQALKVLASTYEPAMRTSIDVFALEDMARSRDPNSPLLLAAYRICEQALLNSALHGGATEVSVSSTQVGDELILTIKDNGSGIGPEPLVPGAGSTVIDAWVAAVDGTWAMEGRDSGTCVTVRVPHQA